MWWLALSPDRTSLRGEGERQSEGNLAVVIDGELVGLHA